jgi:putative transposase
MARAKRYHNPGCFYHVMLRGNNGQNIFFLDSDRQYMFFLLQEGVENYGHQIHAFCFMNNYIHLLIQIGDVPLPKVMHNLGFRHSQTINRKYETAGHLFQGRYKTTSRFQKSS